MKPRIILTFFLMSAIWSVAPGRVLKLVAADPNDLACIPSIYSTPNWADPNEIAGSVLPWTPGDAEGFSADCGKGLRVGTWCDPDGHAVTIEAISDGWTVSTDPNGSWTLAGEIGVGPNYIVVRIRDQPGPGYDGPIERAYTVCVRGRLRENHAPILCSLGWSLVACLLIRWRGKRDGEKAERV